MKIFSKKYSLLVLLILYQHIFSFGMDTKKVIEKGPLDWAFNNILLIIGVLVILAVIWSMLSTFEIVVEYEKKKLRRAQGIPIPESSKPAQPIVVSGLDEPSFLKELYDKAWRLVPQEKEKDILLNHDYDGIRELDNVLPPWWVAMFWGTVIIGFAYLGYYHVWDYGQNSSEEYAAEMKYAESQVNAFLARQTDVVDENNVSIIADESKINLGGTVFIAYCAACHGQQGEGGIGPNLTDKYWIHGGSINDIFKTIKYGVPSKGMIAWKSQLRSADIQNVANYILKIQGTNPPNAKEPQGELVDTSQSIGMK